MDNQTIGEQLRAAMAAKGLSENELSRLSGVPQSTIPLTSNHPTGNRSSA